MNFGKALEEMKESGAKVKLPSWGGYWYWDDKGNTIVMVTKDKKVMDIRETERVEYTIQNIISDEWVFADSENTPVLGGVAQFSFNEALKYLKRGMKVARSGWNGKKQYIELATSISYVNADMETINCNHDAIGNKAIAFSKVIFASATAFASISAIPSPI